MSRIIKAVFTGRFCKTQRVFQFDTDDKLEIVNVDLPANFTVDFSNSKTGDSVSVLATSDTVQIPPDLFVPGSEIYAWIWLSDSNGGYTRCEATIPIDPRARRTGTEPTPAQASAWDEAVETLNDAAEDYADAMGHGPQIIDGYWFIWDADAGEYVNTNVKAEGEDGADGSNAWMIDVQYTDTVNTTIRAKTEHLIGPPNARPMYGDVLFVSDGRFGNIFSPGTRITMATLLGDLHGEPGEDGYSPVVTITEIDGGHRVTITDEDHPQGQSFDVLDGQGGSGSSDYNDLSNKPQIAGVTLSGNKSLADLGIAAASDIPTVPVQSVNGKTGAVVLNASDVGAGTYSKPSGGIPATDLASAVQTSLGKADTALQSAPVTSVNNQTGAVSLSIPSTAADVGAIAAPASPSSAQDLVYLNGAWVAADKLYIVNCTPTALDYSGTIDKTPAQIEAAIQEGKDLLFRIYTSVSGWYDVPWTRVNYSTGNFTHVSFYFVAQTSSGDMLIFGETALDTQTYSTVIYPLSRTACIPAPSSPSTGDFLCWNGSSWAATTVPSANGVSF